MQEIETRYLTVPDAPTEVGSDVEPSRDSVLIVDDVESLRHLFVECLRNRYECVAAANVTEALDELRQRKFSVVVTDVMMPGLSGIELLRKVVDLYPDTAVIVVTGIDRSQRAIDAMRLGAFDYLIKPCGPDVLQLVVERAIKQRDLKIGAERDRLELRQRNEELVEANAKLRRLQAQIVHNEKMASLGQLTAGIAHELNNPVGFIHSNLEILTTMLEKLRAELLKCTPSETQRSAQMLDEVGELVADCREGAVRIRDVVHNLRLFTRLDEGEPKRTSIHDGIDSTIRVLSKYFSQANVKLTRDFGEIPEIEAFPGQLNQLWMNLLSNAAEALGGDPGEVVITTRQKGGEIVVEIRDTGEGIAAEHLGSVFDPFFTTKPVGEGTGLGLSISFGIVQRHGGTIDVRSTPGLGTTFTVTLPIDRCPLDPEVRGEAFDDHHDRVNTTSL
ncbi:MAG: sensor histidine kinase [Pyrinomonadaceae bacterium]